MLYEVITNDRGSLFNTKSFVESNTRQMANHYNMSFTNLLLFLTQGIGEEMVNNNNSSTFFYIVSELLREQKQVQTPLLATDKLATEAVITSYSIHYTKLYDNSKIVAFNTPFMNLS